MFQNGVLCLGDPFDIVTISTATPKEIARYLPITELNINLDLEKCTENEMQKNANSLAASFKERTAKKGISPKLRWVLRKRGVNNVHHQV